MDRKIRFGVIGAGGIAERRTIPGMLLAEHAKLVSVMETERDRVQYLKEKFGAEKAFTSAEELLSDAEIDAVYIASPVVFHAEQARMAADYGKHILLEKPIAMTCDEGEKVLKYIDDRGLKCAAGLMMRFGTHVNNMKSSIAEGKIGQLVSGYSQFTLWLPEQAGNWRQKKSLAGGGCMMDMAVHTIDLVEYITGRRVTSVASMNETITFSYDVEDTSTLLLRLEGGAQCVVQTNFNIPDEAAEWRMEFFGTKGKLMGNTMIGQDDGGPCRALFLKENSEYNPLQVHYADNGILLEGEFGNLYERESFSLSLLKGTPLVAPASDALHVQRIMEAAYRSGNEKKIIDINK